MFALLISWFTYKCCKQFFLYEKINSRPVIHHARAAVYSEVQKSYESVPRTSDTEVIEIQS